ncbi:hypothetical protein KC366_g19 [Hortaea werneckii]|nr:hypothetical protein KC366_g19 [Hortaea werneckii]
MAAASASRCAAADASAGAQQGSHSLVPKEQQPDNRYSIDRSTIIGDLSIPLRRVVRRMAFHARPLDVASCSPKYPIPRRHLLERSTGQASVAEERSRCLNLEETVSAYQGGESGGAACLPTRRARRRVDQRNEFRPKHVKLPSHPLLWRPFAQTFGRRQYVTQQQAPWVCQQCRHTPRLRPSGLLRQQRRWQSNNPADIDPNFKSVVDNPPTLVRTGRKHNKAGLAFLAAIPITAFILGCWQIQRLGWKTELIARFEDRLTGIREGEIPT